MHFEQEDILTAKDETAEEKIISKVTSITQILLPFSAFSLAIRGATLNSGLEDDFEGGDDKCNRVVMKMLVVQPKSLQKCKAVFQLGTSAPLGAGTSFSTLNTTSEYEAANTLKSLNSSTNQHFNLPTPYAFVSPAKTTVAAVTTTTATPPTPNEMLALSSPRRASSDNTTTVSTIKRNGNGGIHMQSGGSSSSREVEEILGTRPVTVGSIEHLSDGGSSTTVPKGSSAPQDALTAYPPSLSQAFIAPSPIDTKVSLVGSSPHSSPPHLSLTLPFSV